MKHIVVEYEHKGLKPTLCKEGFITNSGCPVSHSSVGGTKTNLFINTVGKNYFIMKGRGKVIFLSSSPPQ